MASADGCAARPAATSCGADGANVALDSSSDPPDRLACMLRLRRKADIERTFQQGQRFYCPSAVLHARRRDPQDGLTPVARLSVIAGRHFPTAVARNRARRLLREACRLALADAEAPWDLILLARPRVLTLSSAARLQAITELLRQAAVLAGKVVAAV